MSDFGARPSVSVVVPVLNGEKHVSACLSSVLSTGFPDELREIVVVDNGSTDGTASIVGGFPVQYVFEERRGVSHARNTGIASSRGEVVAFIDADCVVSSPWLDRLVAPFSDGAVTGVAGEIVPKPPITPAQKYHARRKPRWQRPALESVGWPYAVTANVAYRREVFDRVGLFDPHFPKAQDKDFGRRYLDAGMTWVYRPSALVLKGMRATGWELFAQHVGWGTGAACLHRKYGLPWGWRRELGKLGELAQATGRVIRALPAAFGPSGRTNLANAWFEVLRRAGLRLGAVRGRLRPSPPEWAT